MKYVDGRWLHQGKTYATLKAGLFAVWPKDERASQGPDTGTEERAVSTSEVVYITNLTS